MSPEEPIKPTYSVKTAVNELSGEKEPSSWQLVKGLLKHHGEYGGGKAAQMAAGPGPSQPARKPAGLWLEEVSALFDREMVDELHGRLLILGLSRLDPQLKTYLESQGFLRPLADELKEDFESLLLPEPAGDQAYRRTFMKVLQNKPVDGKKPREKGFVVLVRGGPGLQGLAELCHRQTWNSPFSARYVVASDGTFGTALAEFLSDLRGLSKGDQATAGFLLPDPATDLERWRVELASPLESIIKSANEPPGGKRRKEQGEEILRGLVSELEGNRLGTGRRLVLLIEFRRVREGASPEQVGLTSEVVTLLGQLPERVGIVLSGLPDNFPQTLSGLEITTLDLPLDRELTRGQALANDMPGGPDRLNIVGEVNALAEAIALKDMKPPMVVGVMGGWGAGKSFVLHLIENRIQEIRCERVEPANETGESDFPFVGHPYLIRFDAWTYAKGNLWASLMQQVFFELDRQIGLEQTLAKELDISLTDDTEIWRVLSRLTGEEQDRLLKTDLGQEALGIVARFDRGQIAESQLWGVLETLKKQEIEELRVAETELEQKRVARDMARRELGHAIDAQIERDARRSTWMAVTDEFLKAAYEAWLDQASKRETGSETETGPETDTAPPTFAQVEGTIRWYEKLFKEPLSVAIALILFGLAGLIVAVIADLGLPRGVTFTAIVGALGSAWTGLSRFRSWATDAARRFEEAKATNRRLDESMRDELMETALSLARAAEGAETTRAEADDEVEGERPAADETEPMLADVAERARALALLDIDFEAQEMEVEIRQQRVGMAARHGNLLDFVRQRLEGRIYEDKLGLLHQVKSDLEDLSSALLRDDSADDLFPRGKPRIILLIDDLDRCPPDKVVEVLEAAQLLVKTPLFVVVIAMDVRYVTRALEKVYQDVLVRWGEPSGLDYIEKIIQIPYRVRPVSEAAVGSFLWSQMSPERPGGEPPPGAVGAPPGAPPVEDPSQLSRPREFDEGEQGGTPIARSNRSELRVLPNRTLHFSVNDHELISACCASFEVSPRTMKRLVNVFKLLKIIWYRQGLDDGPEPDVKQAMLALLVIAARFPEPMRQLLNEMERVYAGPQPSLAEQVVSYLLGRCQEHRGHALVPQDWDRVEAALGNPALISQELTFEALHERHMHLVSTFSFIGESDPEREATLRRDLSGLLPGELGAGVLRGETGGFTSPT
jgi:hypothetical protein